MTVRLDRALLLFDLDEARRSIRDLTHEVMFECDDCGEPNYLDLDHYDVLDGTTFLNDVLAVIDRVEQIVRADLG